MAPVSDTPAAEATAVGRTPRRIDGYAPIGDYGAIGDGRTLALVALDGSVDWLCLPSFSGPSVFAALLDPARGGRFALAPEAPYTAARRYLPGTNVLETTFVTADGTARVTDALNLDQGSQLPWVELVRRVEGVEGRVRLRWRIEPRFDYGRTPPSIDRHRGVPIVTAGADRMAVLAWGGEDAEPSGDAVAGGFEVSPGERGTVAVLAFHDQPLLVPSREHLERRLDGTIEAWQRFTRTLHYDGPWRGAVERSVLALKLLTYAQSGAIVAAPTTSLPESIGGSANFDYRYAWIRDSTFTMDALLRVGLPEQAHQSLSWLLHASSHTHPRVQPIYDLDGHPLASQEELDLAGYRGSRPVRLGNAAGTQIQLSNYGDLLETAALYVRDGGILDGDTGRRLAEAVDLLCEVWRNPDAGIWELGQQEHYTESKMGCWTALDRAVRLAEAGELPDRRIDRWREEREAVGAWIEERCWSEERRTYVRSPAQPDQLDASVLLVARNGYLPPDDPRLASTIDAIRAELGQADPLIRRFSEPAGTEGAFVACSFWLVEALARSGRLDEAAATMDAMVAHANDLGLLSEEIDPASGELLGNFPQGLSHLSLVNAAAVFERASRGAEDDAPGAPIGGASSS